MFSRSERTVVAMLSIALCLSGASHGGADERRPSAPKSVSMPSSPTAPALSLKSADELFFGTLRRFALWFDASRTNPPVVEAALEIVATQGMSAGLVGQKLHYRFQAPDRGQLQGAIAREPFTLGRDRNELWLWRPKKGLVWRARSTPADPLGPLSVPLLEWWIDRLPTLFVVHREPAAKVGDTRCVVATGVLQETAQRWLGWPAFRLTLWLGETDRRLRQFRVVVPEDRWAITVVVRTIQERAVGDPQRWAAPVGVSNRVEWVTLPQVRGAFPDSFHELGLLQLIAP